MTDTDRAPAPGFHHKRNAVGLRRILRAKTLAHRLRSMVDEQAEDEGLWFEADTAPEAYLQQELRKLHAEVEEFLDAYFPPLTREAGHD